MTFEYLTISVENYQLNPFNRLIFHSMRLGCCVLELMPTRMDFIVARCYRLFRFPPLLHFPSSHWLHTHGVLSRVSLRNNLTSTFLQTVWKDSLHPSHRIRGVYSVQWPSHSRHTFSHQYFCAFSPGSVPGFLWTSFLFFFYILCFFSPCFSEKYNDYLIGRYLLIIWVCKD